MLNVYDLENLKKNINNIYIMASRKYMSRRNKSKSKGQKRRRTLKRKYGKKRGGFFEYFLGNKKTTSTPSSISGGDEVQSAQTPAPALSDVPSNTGSLGNTASSTSGSAGNTASIPGPASDAALTIGQKFIGGKRRRRRKSSKKSRKGRKSRRKQRGGCIGFAFQPSVVTPPNSALANPAPIARYTTGP